MSNLVDQRKPNLLQSQFMEAILDSYQNYNLENAQFLAERLRFIQDNEQSKCILAEIYFQQRNYWAVKDLLQNQISDRARYLYAYSCYHIEKYQEAEEKLTFDVHKNQLKNLDDVIYGAHGIYLLGLIREKKKQILQASECYLKAYEKNPLLFKAYQKFLNLQEQTEPKDIEKLVGILKLKNINEIQGVNLNHSIFQEIHELNKCQKENNVFTDVSIKKNLQDGKANKFSFQKMTSQYQTSDIKKINFKKKSPSKKKNKEKQISSSQKNQNLGNILNKTIYDVLYQVQRPYGYFRIQQYKLSLQFYDKLQNLMKNDPWVLTYMARCYSEMQNNKQAYQYYQKAFKIDPLSIEGKDYYSSCLYVLQKHKDLVELAMRYHEKHFFQTETWIILANLYSLNRDRDTALTFLKRAIQIDSQNSYALCLMGHEYSQKEQYEKAITSYNNALIMDKRNIRAYFGLGLAYTKINDYKKAIDYFKYSIKINGETGSAYTQIANAKINLNEYDEALQNILISEKLQPKDEFTKYTKARILNSLGRFKEAQKVCEEMKKGCKNEVDLLIQLGDIYAAQNMQKEAQKEYIEAMNLDKSKTQELKNKIASLMS